MLSDTACKEIERLREFDDSGDEEQQPARINWIYTLKKDELVKDLEKFSLIVSTKGILPTLRKRFFTHFSKNVFRIL